MLPKIFPPVGSITTGEAIADPTFAKSKDNSKEKLAEKERVTITFDDVNLAIGKAIHYLAMLFRAAIVLFVLGAIAPSLRERIPAMFQVTDMLLDLLQWITQTVLEFANKFF